MALTRITKGVIKPNENYDTHNINSTGIVTAVAGNFSGDLTVGGVLTYEDVTSIDSVGLITARNGIDCNGDLDVDGHTELDNVRIAGVSTFIGQVNSTANVNVNGGRIILYGDGDALFQGAAANMNWDRSDNALEFADDAKAVFGASSDLQIYHGSNISFINDSYGDLRIMSNTLRLQRQAGGENFLYATEGGKVSLFYDGSQKFETTNTGVVISGICTATSFSGDGSNLTGITGVTVNSQSDNRVITATGTSNTLQSEPHFTHDSTNCDTSITGYEALKVIDLIVKNTNNHGNAAGARITIESGSSANTGPQFGMICGSDNWYLQTPKNVGALDFHKNGTRTFRLMGDGDVQIADGDLVLASGHGIDFSSDPNGGMTNSEVLDDYEEGYYYPAAYGTSSTTSAYYYSSENKLGYVKIGKLVTIMGRLRLQADNYGGGLRMTLPYAAVQGSNTSNSAMSAVGTHGVNFDSDDMGLFIEIFPNTSYADFIVTQDNQGWINATNNYISANDYLAFQLSYVTND